MAETNNKNNKQKQTRKQPKVKTRTIIKRIVVKPKVVKPIDPPPTEINTIATHLATYFNNLKNVLTVPVLIYLLIVFAIYSDTVNNNSSTLKAILTYLSKFSIIQPFVSFLASHPTKLFAILVYGTILMSDERTDKHYYWFFSLSIFALVTTDAPILLYALQSLSIMMYMANNAERSFMSTILCLLPIFYYVFSIQSTLTTLDNPKDPYDNYTLPPIILNTTQSPILSRRILDTSV